MFANNPRIVTNGIVGVWDPLMKSTALPGPATETLLYDQVTSNNASTYTGTCLDFDGTDDFVSIADDSTLDITGDMTVSCWVALDSAMNNNLGILVNKRDNSDSTNPFLLYFEDRGGEDSFRFSMGEGSSSEQIGSDDNFDGAYDKWDHVVATISGTTMSLYVNGVLDATGTFSGSRQTNNIPIRLGASYTNGSYDYPMEGQMADVRVYSAALSAANVKEIYDDSKVILPYNISQTNLKGWWPLVDGAGDYAYDGSGNGNDGTLTNMTSADWLTGQTGCPQLVEGYNRPMLFDGNNDYVQVASDGSSTFANQSYTVAGWIQIGDLTSDKGIFSYDFTSHASPYYATHVRVTANELYLLWNDGSSYQYISKTSAFTVNTWHHYACTFTSGSQKIYIDGAEVASGTRADTITYYNQEVWIGKNNYSTSFNSLMNETVVYNSALTLAQVQVLAATGPNGGPLPPDPMSLSNSSNVVGYWRNDGNVTWKDRSGNGNDGTVYGSPDNLLFKQGINGSASTSTGRDGQGFPLLYQNNGAMGFTQTGGSKVIIPHSSDILWDINANFTIITWYKINSNPSGTYPSVWGKGGQHVSGPGYELFLNPDGTSFTLRGTWAGGPTWGMNAAYGSAGNPMDGNWHCVTVAIDRDNPTTGGMLYQDNVRQSAVNISGLGDTTNTTNLTLASAGAGLWNGQIAGAQIYSRVLTDKELTQNFNAQRSRFNA